MTICSGQARLAACLTQFFLVHSLAGVPLVANSPEVPVFVKVSNKS